MLDGLLGRMHYVGFSFDDVRGLRRLERDDRASSTRTAAASSTAPTTCRRRRSSSRSSSKALKDADLNYDRDVDVRCIIEKPFGTDLESALRAAGRSSTHVFREQQVFRIDHYLGKETVQNVMAFRFANFMFEPVWNRNYIDHIQITAAEDIGIGSRAGYYDQAGALRDLVQNHMLQLLTLVCMEPPATLRGRQGARREGQGPAGDHAADARGGAARHGARAVHRRRRGRRGGRRLPRRGRRARTTRAPRPTRRCASRSTTGAGPACRSSCAPASGSRAR